MKLFPRSIREIGRRISQANGARLSPSPVRDIIRNVGVIYFGVRGSNIDAGMRPTMEQLILLIDSDQRPTNMRPKVYPGLLRRYSVLLIEIT